MERGRLLKGKLAGCAVDAAYSSLMRLLILSCLLLPDLRVLSCGYGVLRLRLRAGEPAGEILRELSGLYCFWGCRLMLLLLPFLAELWEL